MEASAEPTGIQPTDIQATAFLDEARAEFVGMDQRAFDLGAGTFLCTGLELRLLHQF